MRRQFRAIDHEIDDEFLAVQPTRFIADRSNPLEEFRDREFFERFRFSKPAFRVLVDFVDGNLTHRVSETSLTSCQRLLIFCRVLAQNNFQIVTGELFNVSKSTVCRVVDEMSQLFTENAGHFIKWPTHDEQRQISARYFARTNIPELIGAIDGSHVRIIRPVEQEEQYVNRKGYHSINIGAICDDRRRFLWLSTQFPGRTHDSRVFRESQIYQEFSQGNKTGILAGDSAYALESFLLKPILKPTRTVQEINFTNALCRARVDIEHSFGVLKRQWHILHSEVRYNPQKAGRLITSCVCLRNFSISCKETEFDGPEDDYDDDQPDALANADQSGNEVLNSILTRFF